MGQRSFVDATKTKTVLIRPKKEKRKIEYLFPFVVNGKDDLHWCAGYIIDVSDCNLCYVNLRIIDKVTLENLRNPTYAVITALNSPRSAPIEGIQPSVDQDVSDGKVLSKWR